MQLQQGVMASASVYSEDPPAMAKHWCDLGARRLHVVDLDGAFAGEPVNQRLVEGIVDAAGDVPVQIGGGIRSIDTAQAYIAAGVSQVIAGTQATENPDFLHALAAELPGRTILGLDAKDGKAATRGWTTTSGVDVLAFAEDIRELDLFAIVYTDVARDGMLSGVNAPATRRLAEVAGAPVIASGGVRNLDDLRALKALDLGAKRLLGAISGSALYEGTLDFACGQRLLDDG